MIKKFVASFCLSVIFWLPSEAQIITTIAGDSTIGFCCDGAAATMAELNQPNDIAMDVAGNIYITDGENNRIRMINAAGIIRTIAGTGAAGYNGDGIAATDAKINYPTAIAIDSLNNIFFCDDHNARIRKINAAGMISTIAGTGVPGYNGDGIPATAAQITSTAGIALDRDHNIYFSDLDSNRLRKIDGSGIITTIVGSHPWGYSGDGGPASSAKINQPFGVAIDHFNNIYFSEFGNNCVRKINASGIITTVAGTGAAGYSGDGGPATNAMLHGPFGVKLDDAGNIYIADTYNNRIRKVDNTGYINLISGNGNNGFNGDGIQPLFASIAQPNNIYIDKSENIYIADWENSRVRHIKSTEAVAAIKNPNVSQLIYPNPNIGIFTIAISSTDLMPKHIVITDVFGKIVFSKSNIANQSLEVVLGVPDGIYYVAVRSTNSISYCKLVIAR